MTNVILNVACELEKINLIGPRLILWLDSFMPEKISKYLGTYLILNASVVVSVPILLFWLTYFVLLKPIPRYGVKKLMQAQEREEKQEIATEEEERRRAGGQNGSYVIHALWNCMHKTLKQK